ncbi:MAG TPA: ADOP family duplicated permease [Gemmatimonadales bacterium]|nr:ADOP family duplicated permease [Gemmatimonadales bacterium]
MTLWLYRALVRLLPRRVREHDAEEMVRALADQIAAAPSPSAIRWRALRRFPRVLALEWRDALFAGPIPTAAVSPRGSRMDAIARMIRQGARGLARTPAFSLSVILLLGVGVGSVSAIFAIVDHVLLRPLPYPAADRLVVVENGSHSVPALRDMQAMHSIEAWGAAATDNTRLTGQGEPLRIRQAVVTDGFFPMFGAHATIGRLLQPADSQLANTAVLSWGLWRRVFGGDSTIVGRTIRLDGAPIMIVGVLDRNFVMPEAVAGATVDIWRPLDPAAEYMTSRNVWMFEVAGRLRASATIARAQQEASLVASQRARAFPDQYTDDGKVKELPVRSLRDATTGDVQQPLRVLLGAVSLLLLVACANVTHLVLARGVGRTREMAVRRALGARTRSLAAQLLIECGMLGTAGAALGALIAYAGVRAFLTLMPTGLPRATTITVDARVLLFAGAIGMLTTIVFGLMPALRLARRGGDDPLRASGRSLTGSRGAQRLRSALVVGEVAVSLVLVAQAGWLLRSFIRMSHEELGFRTSGVVEIPMSIPTPTHASGELEEAPGATWNRRMEAIRTSLAETRGVQGVTYGLSMPLEWVGGNKCCWAARPDFAGKKSPDKGSIIHPVSDDYFDVLAVRLVAGAPWARGTATGTPYPGVISEQLANQVFGSAKAAIGATFALGKTKFQVVGVAGNTREYGADQPYRAAVYIPASAIPFAPDEVTMAVRTDRTDGALATDLRAAIWRAEPDLPVPTIAAVAELSHQDSAHRRFDAMLFGTFSAVALLLVAGGLAGTLLYMVSLQRRSMGIRLALGATPGGLERSVLARGVGLAGIGVIIGTISAWFAGKLIESQLYGVEARDIRTLGLAVGVLMLIALLSSWIPARRAATTNPMESFRAE